MQNQVQGQIEQIFEEQSGVSKAGNDWRKRDVLINLGGNYPRRLLITFFGDRSDMLENYKKEDEVIIDIDLESREYNGRWYTSVNGWRIVPANNAPASQEDPFASGSGSPNFDAQPTADTSNQFESSEGDDLPF